LRLPFFSRLAGFHLRFFQQPRHPSFDLLVQICPLLSPVARYPLRLSSRLRVSIACAPHTPT
jgi:hypothetical protein